jgi:hypothetical protein
MEVAGNMFPPIIGLKLPVVKARVPNQKRHNGKAVSHRNCTRRAHKGRLKEPDLIVCQKYLLVAVSH